MSYHSSMQWTWDDGISKKLIDEIVTGLLANKSYMQDEQYTPTFYSVMGPIDMFLSKIGSFLDDYPKSLDRTDDVLTAFAKDAPNPELVGQILRKTIEQLGVGK